MEVFYNKKNDVFFEIYLTEKERKTVTEKLNSNPVEVLNSFSNISARASTCWVLNDQNRIHGLIECSVGFDQMDRKLREAIAKALEVDKTAESLDMTKVKESSSRSDGSDGDRDAENSALKDEISKLKE